MIVTLNNLSIQKITTGIEVNMYREQLLRYIEDYQINLHNTGNIISIDENKKAKIFIASMVEPDNLELQKEREKIRIGAKTRFIIRKYMRPIMFMLGSIAECIIIDKCKQKPSLNMKCINYALFKADINQEYNDIEYDMYTPFSPSHKRIVMYNESGIVYYRKNRFVYEPNHINKDIVWCNKKNLEDILKVKIPYTEYELMARLQVKASTNFHYIDWNEEKYRFSPIMYFDIHRDINHLYKYLKARHSNLYVRSVLDFDIELMQECNWYFRLLAGHFSGLINLRNEIDINKSDNMNKGILKYIFDSDINALLDDRSIVKSEQLLQGVQDIILANNEENIIDVNYSI